MSDRQDHNAAVEVLERLREESSASEQMFAQQRQSVETILKIAKSQVIPRGKTELLIPYDQRGSYFHGLSVICQECGERFAVDQHRSKIRYCLNCGFEVTNAIEEKTLEEMRTRESRETAESWAAIMGGTTKQ